MARKGTLDGIKRFFTAYDKISVVNTFQALDFRGSVASVKVTQQLKAYSKPNAKGQRDELRAMFVTYDTWQKLGGTWQLIKIKEVARPTYALNGKPFNPNAKSPK
jgi:hypothetical protein